MAAFAHGLFGFDWTTAGILGAALAPTDPAVMFSVLGNREVGGRSGTILEGESGANDPVGIALVLGILELETSSGSNVVGQLSTPSHHPSPSASPSFGPKHGSQRSPTPS